MLRKAFILALIVVIPALLATAWAVDDREIEGKGAFVAKGVGHVRVKGIGLFHVEGKGFGTLVIRGAENCHVRLHGSGHKIRLPNGTLLVFGFKGKATIRGAHVDASFTGGKVRVLAAGKGKAWLRGKGKFRVRGEWHLWKDAPPIIRF